MPASASRPATISTGTVLVAHPAWETARTAILDLAAVGPVTVLLAGAPGTGKTWLLRALCAEFHARGRSATLLRQGDLPFQLEAGSVLLIDEAARMPAVLLDEMLAQDRGVVVLADIERFGASVGHRSTRLVVVPLRTVTAGEAEAFASSWLQQAGLPAGLLDEDALRRLVVHGGGSVRLLTHLLGATVALGTQAGQPQTTAVVTASGIDDAAAMRLGGLVTAHAEPRADLLLGDDPPPSIVGRPRRRISRPRLAAATALAASVALGWSLWTARVPATGVPGPTALPLLVAAQTASPALAERSLPVPATTGAVDSILARPTPVSPAGPVQPDDARPVRVATAMPSPIELASPPLPQLGGIPIVAASADPVPEPSRFSRRRGGPGMILLAQRGDTLESMYQDIYRDRVAPPYAEMVAANPSPLRPGAIVVFPEPPGGWLQHYR